MKLQDHDQPGDLPQLLDVLINAVTTLDSVGADSYRDVYLFVSGCRGEARLSDLTVQCGRISVTPPIQPAQLPVYVRADDGANRRALIMAELCYIVSTWGWEIDEAARHLGCAAAVLNGWILASAGNEDPSLPELVVNRVQRLIVLEHQRLLIGVHDEDVRPWLRRKRAAFGGRSILQLLLVDGEAGFRRIHVWLLNGMAAARTVH